MVVRWRDWARPTIAVTIASDAASRPRPSTNDRSTFNTSTGNRFR